ncbi:MAG: Maf family protein [Oligoflexia bacterium]|nr:Maf family protein [Oligoflexia bacterium]
MKKAKNSLIRVQTPLFLASNSPRRQELLTTAQIPFRVILPKDPELESPKTLNRQHIDKHVTKVAKAKCLSALKTLKDQKKTSFLVLSADTIVYFDKKILGKPKNENDAKKTLSLLSGKYHEVKTAVCVTKSKNRKVKIKTIVVTTKVKFYKFPKNWIEYYVSTGEPLDKAGSYGAQSIGQVMIESIEGSYTNVIGLPISETCNLLGTFS